MDNKHVVRLCDFIDYSDGTLSFSFHHVCSGTYGLSSEQTFSKLRHMEKKISNRAGDYLTQLVHNNPEIYTSEFLSLESVEVSSGIQDTEVSRNAMFINYFDKVEISFLIRFNVRTNINKNLIKLKNPHFFNDCKKTERELMEQINIDEPVVFIEEFLFSESGFKGLVCL